MAAGLIAACRPAAQRRSLLGSSRPSSRSPSGWSAAGVSTPSAPGRGSSAGSSDPVLRPLERRLVRAGAIRRTRRSGSSASRSPAGSSSSLSDGSSRSSSGAQLAASGGAGGWAGFLINGIFSLLIAALFIRVIASWFGIAPIIGASAHHPDDRLAGRPDPPRPATDGDDRLQPVGRLARPAAAALAPARTPPVIRWRRRRTGSGSACGCSPAPRAPRWPGSTATRCRSGSRPLRSTARPTRSWSDSWPALLGVPGRAVEITAGHSAGARPSRVRGVGAGRRGGRARPGRSLSPPLPSGVPRSTFPVSDNRFVAICAACGHVKQPLKRSPGAVLVPGFVVGDPRDSPQPGPAYPAPRPPPGGARAPARQRILVLDGAMGTMIQRHDLTEADYRGERFAAHASDLKGNNDLLSLTRPEIIRGIHDAYLEAGADIIETNSFNSTAVSLADYGLEALARELNRAAAEVARAAADSAEAREPGRPRFVAGASGRPIAPPRSPRRQRPRVPQHRLRRPGRRLRRGGRGPGRGRRGPADGRDDLRHPQRQGRDLRDRGVLRGAGARGCRS